MNTTTESMPRDDHRRLCCLVESLIPHLKWRHNGLGLLQAYVREGQESELRVHIWHRSLQHNGIEDSGLIHDHRFDLTSCVLFGELAQTEFDLYETPIGAWQTHSVVHAREAMAKHAINDGDVTAQPERYGANVSVRFIQQGDVYRFPKRRFHCTSNESNLLITLVTKSAQEKAPARILAPWGKPVVHAFADTLPESEWAPILQQAQAALHAEW